MTAVILAASWLTIPRALAIAAAGVAVIAWRVRVLRRGAL